MSGPRTFAVLATAVLATSAVALQGAGPALAAQRGPDPTRTTATARLADGGIHLDSCGVPITAHRGDVGPVTEYDENTIGAALRALTTSGASATEYDVRTTRNQRADADHPWWVMHDKNVRRTTDGDHAVATATPRYMRSLHTRDGSAPPSADQMFDLAAGLPDRGLQNEIKRNPLTGDGTYPQADVDQLLQAMVDKGVWPRVFITSFDADVLGQVAGSPVTLQQGAMPLGLISGKNFSVDQVAALPSYVDMVNVPLGPDLPALAAALHATGRGLSVRNVDSPADLDLALDVSSGTVGPDHADNIVTNTTAAVVAECAALQPAG